jgi:O-antigen ligase
MFLLVLPVTHTVTLRLLLLLITLIMAGVAFAKGDKSRPPCLIAWMLWLGFALLSLTTAVDLSYSAGEIKTEIGYGFIAFFSFYVLTRRWQQFITLTAVLLAGLFILSSAAIYDSLMWGTWQSEGFYGGVGDFSSYLITLLPLLLLLAYRQHKNKPRLTLVLSIVSGILFLLSAYKTMNLMFWLSLLVQLVTLLLLSIRGRIRHTLTVSFVVFGLALSLLVAVGMQKSRINELTPQGIAALFTKDTRIKHWENVEEIISQQPFRGDGFGRATLAKAHPEVRVIGALWHSHNIFLDAAVQMGLQGAFALLLLFACLAWHFNRHRLRQDRDLQAIGIVGLVLLVGIISKNMTDNFFTRHLSLMFWSEVGMLLGLAKGLLFERQSADSVNHPAPQPAEDP